MINEVTLIGRVSSKFTYDHEIYGEKYYRITLSVERDSGTVDKLPVLISERLINTKDTRGYIAVKGQFRSYKSGGKLILYVFATEIELLDKPYNYNDIYLEGIISKQPTYRLTPYGREISDVFLIVHRDYNKFDYIPCICWGRTAKFMKNLSKDTCVRVAGRVQSRDYIKNGETKTAYEVSVSLAELV